MTPEKPVGIVHPVGSALERQPLRGVRVVVTRARANAPTLSAKLRELGADVIEMAATRIQPLDQGALADAISRLGDYQWLVLTSQNAVELFTRALRTPAHDARIPGGLKVAAVGPATSDALAQCGVSVDVIPARFTAEGLLSALTDRSDVTGSRMLYLAARGARDVLPTGLRAAGATVDVVTLYESVPDAMGATLMRERLLGGAVDIVTFTSASAVRAFGEAVGADAAARARLVSIGPATSEAIRSAGLHVHAEADPSTLDGLVGAVLAGWV